MPPEYVPTRRFWACARPTRSISVVLRAARLRAGDAVQLGLELHQLARRS